MKDSNRLQIKEWGLYLFVFVVCFLQSCYEDKGNYDYLSPEECAPTIVSELEESSVWPTEKYLLGMVKVE